MVRSESGLGLGLSITMCLAKQLGTGISIETVVGEGSSFSLTLKDIERTKE